MLFRSPQSMGHRESDLVNSNCHVPSSLPCSSSLPMAFCSLDPAQDQRQKVVAARQPPPSHRRPLPPFLPGGESRLQSSPGRGRSRFAQRSAALRLVGLLPGPGGCQAGPGPCLSSTRGTPRWAPLPPLCLALPRLTGAPVAPHVSICPRRQKRVLDSSRTRPLQLEPSRVSGPQAPWQGLKAPLK